MYCEIVVKWLGVIIKIGMGIFVDLCIEGVKMFVSFKDNLVELLMIYDEEWLFYLSFLI